METIGLSNVTLVIIQVICIVITLLAIRGEKDEESALAVLLAFLPGLGYLVALISIVQIVARIVSSSGKCILGHSYIDVTPTPPRGMRMRVAVGGYNKYECSKCKNKTSVKWCAF